jgi:hypothetical protein
MFTENDRLITQTCGINRVRCCPQRSGLVAVWGDNGSVRLLDLAAQLESLAAETEPATRAASKTQARL